MAKQAEYIKIRRGGERFWCEVMSRADGRLNLRCANDTIEPENPRLHERFSIAGDEPIIERAFVPREFSVVDTPSAKEHP